MHLISPHKNAPWAHNGVGEEEEGWQAKSKGEGEIVGLSLPEKPKKTQSCPALQFHGVGGNLEAFRPLRPNWPRIFSKIGGY
jgi:hypothetical protein